MLSRLTAGRAGGAMLSRVILRAPARVTGPRAHGVPTLALRAGAGVHTGPAAASSAPPAARACAGSSTESTNGWLWALGAIAATLGTTASASWWRPTREDREIRDGLRVSKLGCVPAGCLPPRAEAQHST